MRRFARLCAVLDRRPTDADALAALSRYFAQAAPADAAWAVQLLSGARPVPRLPPALLRQAVCRQAGVDDWLFDACLQAVGDVAETIALLLPDAATDAPADVPGPGLAECLEQRLLPLRGLAPAEQAARLPAAWDAPDRDGRWLLLKLLSGGLRVGLSRLLLQRALALQAGLDAPLLAQRLTAWPIARRSPTAADYRALMAAPDATAPLPGQPWPLCTQPDLAAEPAGLGDGADWQAQWRYDGLRAQLVRRAGLAWLWSEEEALLTPRFPEVAAWAAALPEGCVLDGLLLAWPEGAARPASRVGLRARLARQSPGRRLPAEAPAVFVAHDLLQRTGVDLRAQPQHERRRQLEALLADQPQHRSPSLPPDGWQALAALRAQAGRHGAAGLLLQRRDAAYGAAGACALWPAPALTLDAVLVYTQADGDCTFAVWSRPPADAAEAQAVLDAVARREPAPGPGALRLLPCARARGGLDPAEWARLAPEIRALTLDKFGPVRSLRPTLVFELAFEAVDPSPRHKSGIALRAPQLLRVRRELQPWQAGALPALLAHLRGG